MEFLVIPKYLLTTLYVFEVFVIGLIIGVGFLFLTHFLVYLTISFNDKKSYNYLLNNLDLVKEYYGNSTQVKICNEGIVVKTTYSTTLIIKKRSFKYLYRLEPGTITATTLLDILKDKQNTQEKINQLNKLFEENSNN